jgi:hypothetical protein
MLLKRIWQKRLKTRILNYHNANYGDYFLGHEAPAPPKATACHINFFEEDGNYSVCHKFLPFGDSKIPLNPPFSKTDFNSNSLQFPSFFKGGQGGL